jgi:hypothetical protein
MEKEIDDLTKEALARVLNYVLLNEESSYEETTEEYGIDSHQAYCHVYNIARTLWQEFELDLS